MRVEVGDEGFVRVRVVEVDPKDGTLRVQTEGAATFWVGADFFLPAVGSPGSVRTDADVAAAAVQMREALCREVRSYAFNTLAKHLEALPLLPHADALAAVIEKAKAEVWEEAARLHDQWAAKNDPETVGRARHELCAKMFRARGARGA